MALADATVRVILDVSRFDRDLQKQVAGAARRAGRRFEAEFNRSARQAATRWSQSFEQQASQSMAGAGTRAGNIFGGAVRRSARPTGRLTGRDLGEQIRGGLLQTADRTGRLYGRNLLVGSLTEAGNRMGQRLGRAISVGMNVTGVGTRLRQQIETDSRPGILAAARTVAGRFAAALGAAFGSISIGRLGLLVAGVTALVSEGIQLAAALQPVVQSIGLLPPAAAVATASISTLVVAFQGMGDALSAAAEGDAEKLAEAMETLAPAARTVVEEFAALMPQLSDMRREVQQAFFSELIGDMERLGQTLLGPVQRGMVTAAGAAGRMTSGLIGVFSSVRGGGAMEEIFSSAARAFDQMNVPLQRMTAGMLEWIRATLPAFDELIVSLGEGAERFGAFLTRAAASGQAMAWVNQAITTISQLGRITVSAGRLIGTIFDAARDAGGNYLNNLNNALIATRQFLAVGEGRTGLVDTFEGIHRVVQALAEPLRASVVALGQLSQVGGSVAQALSSGVAAAIRGIGQALTAAGPGLTRFAESVGGVLTDLGDVLPSIGASIGRLLTAIGPLVSVFGVAARVAAALLEVFSSLPGPVLTVIAAFAGMRALGLPDLLGSIQQRAGALGGTFATVTASYQNNLTALTAMGVQQRVATAAMASGIPVISQFGVTVGGLAERALAAGGAIGGPLLRGAQALIGALGGGIGIALTAASVLIGFWAEEQAKADRAVAEHNQRVRQLGSTLDKVTGSITNATRAQAQQTFASSELADSASRLGLSIDRVAEAATGNEVGQKRMLDQLRNSARGALEVSGQWQDMETSARNLGVTTEVLLNALLGQEDAVKRVIAAAEDSDASFSTMEAIWGRTIRDQAALGKAINQTASDLQRQTEAIQRANAQYGPAQRLADDLAEAMGVLADNSSTAADKARALDSALRLLNGGTIDLADAQKANADAIAAGNEQMEQLAEKYNIAGKSAADLGISTEELATRQAELGQRMFDSGGQLNFASERVKGLYEASKQLRQATLDQTSAIIDNAQKTGGDMAQAHQRAADLINASRAQIIQWATDAGLGADAGKQLADMMGLIPENVRVALEMQNVPAILTQLSQIKGDIELLPDRKSLRLDSNARGMADELKDLGFLVQDIPGSKDIKIVPNTDEAAAALRTFIQQQVTSQDADFKVNADTSAAQLSAEKLREFIKAMPASIQPGLESGPVIAEWQNLLLGPLLTQPGTPTVTPGVDGSEVSGWFQHYLAGLVTPGTPTITPGVDGGPAAEQLKGMEHTFPIPIIGIVPFVDGKPAFDQMGGLLGSLAPPPGSPAITPGVDGSIPESWFDYYTKQLEGNPPEVTPGVNPGPASFQLDRLLQNPPAGTPMVVPAANTAPAQGQLQNLILQVNNAQTRGPTINGNTVPANTQLALLLNRVNQSRGNVTVGANTGAGYGATNALVNYANRVSGAVGVGADTGSAYTAVNALVRYINSRVATVTVNTSQSASPSVRAAEGGLFKFFAGGGINSFRNTMRSMPANRAEIVPPKTMRIIGDRARGDEAFIPLVNSTRSRSILAAASARMGFDLVPRPQQQQDVAAARTTNVEAGAIVVNAPYANPALVARAVVNELTREAVM